MTQGLRVRARSAHNRPWFAAVRSAAAGTRSKAILKRFCLLALVQWAQAAIHLITIWRLQ
jgi:hypothetical protein